MYIWNDIFESLQKKEIECFEKQFSFEMFNIENDNRGKIEDTANNRITAEGINKLKSLDANQFRLFYASPYNIFDFKVKAEKIFIVSKYNNYAGSEMYCIEYEHSRTVSNKTKQDIFKGNYEECNNFYNNLKKWQS